MWWTEGKELPKLVLSLHFAAIYGRFSTPGLCQLLNLQVLVRTHDTSTRRHSPALTFRLTPFTQNQSSAVTTSAARGGTTLIPSPTLNGLCKRGY